MFISFLWGVFVRGVFVRGFLSRGFLSRGFLSWYQGMGSVGYLAILSIFQMKRLKKPIVSKSPNLFFLTPKTWIFMASYRGSCLFHILQSLSLPCSRRSTMFVYIMGRVEATLKSSKNRVTFLVNCHVITDFASLERHKTGLPLPDTKEQCETNFCRLHRRIHISIIKIHIWDLII